MKFVLIPSLALAVSVLLGGCDTDPLAELSDFELEQKYAQCLDKQPTAPGKATACENLRGECEARANNGNYVCRKY